MSRLSRIFFLAMSTAFGLCIAGLILGMAYDLFVVFIRHRTLESVLGNSIPYYKTLGALGILGMICFFGFLFASMSGKNH